MRASQRDLFVALLLGILTCITAYSQMVPGVCGTFHDDAIYVANATALASGEGYRLINLPGAPLQTKYPILYPAVLAMLSKLSGESPENLVWLQLFSILCAGLTSALAYLYVIKLGYSSTGVAFAAALACATAHLYLYYAGLTLSEMFFAVLFVLTLWSYDRYLSQEGSPLGGQIISGVLLGLLILCRLVGVVCIPVFAWYGFRARKGLGWMALATGVLIVPWFIWSGLSAGVWGESPAEAYYTNYYGWWSEGASNFFNVLVFNTAQVIFFLFTRLFDGISHFAPQRGLSAVTLFGQGMGLLLWLGFAKQVRQWRLLPTTLLVYIVAICLFPGPPTRILIPLLVLLVVIQLQGVHCLLAGLRMGRLLAWVFWICLGVSLLANVSMLFRYRDLSVRTNFPYMEFPTEPVDWGSYESTFVWLRANTAPDHILAATYDSMVYLYTKRSSIQPYVLLPSRWLYASGERPYGTPEEVIELLARTKARYLVVLPMPIDPQQDDFYSLVEDLKRLYPQKLRRVYLGEDHRFRVYRVRKR